MVCALAYVAVHTFPPYGAHLYVPPPHMPLPGLCPYLLHEIWLIRPHICPMAFRFPAYASSLVPCLMPTWIVTHCTPQNTCPLSFYPLMSPNMPPLPWSMPTWAMTRYAPHMPDIWYFLLCGTESSYVPPLTFWANAQKTFDLLGPAILYFSWY